jgi:hypothetical protein
LQRGRRFSLPARTVSLVLPGSNYQPADVQRFAEAAAAADLSLLEIAWAVAAEDVRSYSLQEMAKLLFDDAAALLQYITFSMLLHDAIYFKQVSSEHAPQLLLLLLICALHWHDGLCCCSAAVVVPRNGITVPAVRTSIKTNPSAAAAHIMLLFSRAGLQGWRVELRATRCRCSAGSRSSGSS